MEKQIISTCTSVHHSFPLSTPKHTHTHTISMDITAGSYLSTFIWWPILAAFSTTALRDPRTPLEDHGTVKRKAHRCVGWAGVSPTLLQVFPSAIKLSHLISRICLLKSKGLSLFWTDVLPLSHEKWDLISNMLFLLPLKRNHGMNDG